MKIEDKIRGKNKLRYDINRKAANQHYHQVKLIQMNILQRRRHCLLIKVES